ncbi:MAG: hypothetical protein FWE62_01300, partial [Firmicutes bacterium]|nr:hypothetical protein [Bacillota bacterium]
LTVNAATYKYYQPMPSHQWPSYLSIAENPLTGELMSTQPSVPMYGTLTIENDMLLYETYTIQANLYDYVGIKKRIQAKAPVITEQPQPAAVFTGVAASLEVAASSPDGGSLSYQWYSNTTESNSGGTLISGAVSATYALDTSTAGIKYYYVVVTNTNSLAAPGYQTATAVSDAVSVTAMTLVQPAAIGGAVAPVGGEKPSTAISNGAGFAAYIDWGGVTEFDYETVYTATVALLAQPAFTFAGAYGDTASIAGFTVNGIAPVWVQNTGGALVFTVTFPATGEDTGGGTELPPGGGTETPPGGGEPTTDGCSGGAASMFGLFVVLGATLFLRKRK